MNKKLEIQYHGLTDPGKTRTTNEDCFWCGEVCGGRFILATVIDGCGGHQGGLQAATMTRDALLESLDEQSYADDTAAWLQAAMTEANNQVYNGRYDDEALAEMCCVATAIIIDRERGILYMAHVGDTRLYASHEGRIIKLSHDHSPIGKQEELSYLSETEAMNHWQRNIIDRAIGHKYLYPMDKYIEVQSFPLTGGLTLLLCSDGLYDMVTSAQMSEILRQQVTPAQMAAELVEAANQAGGKDNVTVVVLHTTPEEPEVTARLMDVYAERMNPYKRPLSAPKDIPASQPESETQSESESPEPANHPELEAQPAPHGDSLPENPDSPQQPSKQDAQSVVKPQSEVDIKPESEPQAESYSRTDPAPQPEAGQKPEEVPLSEAEPESDNHPTDLPKLPQAQSPEVPHTPECGNQSADHNQTKPRLIEKPSDTQDFEPERVSSLPFTRTEKRKRRAKVIDRIIFVAVWLVMVIVILIGFRYYQSRKRAYIEIQNRMIRQQMEIQQLQNSISLLQDSIRTLHLRYHHDTDSMQTDTTPSQSSKDSPPRDEP